MMRPSYRLHANKLAGWRAALAASASLVLGLTLHAGPVLADPASMQDSRAGQGQGGQDSAVSGTEGDLSASDASGCWRVQGHLVERLVPPGQCSSPVGLCTIARMFGGLRGDALFIANEFISSTHAVALFTARGWRRSPAVPADGRACAVLRLVASSAKRKGPSLSRRALVEIIPAVTYSPTQLPMQYHRR